MQNIWIINHNATPPQLAGLCRHYYFSKYLRQDGYSVRIMSASTIHNTNINMIEDKSVFLEKEMDGVPYTFLRCSKYTGNGISRIKNMLEFPFRVWQVYNKFEKPDVIYASSPDPFSALSAILLAKRLKVPSILEIRDLWPESIVCYKGMSRKNPIIIALYMLEKWMYKRADRLIFTMEGGKDYIIERGWDIEHGGPVDLNKVYHINNGVDLEEFDYNKEHFTIDDEDLNDPNTFKVVYTGSIRAVNNLGMLVDVAKTLQRELPQVKLLIWGDGNERAQLEQSVVSEQLSNIVFKGKVEKKFVPFIIAQAHVNILHARSTDIMRFGFSPNKLFDYFAAQKPILLTFSAKDALAKSDAIILSEENTAEHIAKAITKVYGCPLSQCQKQCTSAEELSRNYDYRVLTRHLEKIICEVIQHEKNSNFD